MGHLLDWVDVVIIGWVVVSALITPVVGRFLGHMFSDTNAEHAETDFRASVPHDLADG